ncbi:MAG: DUF2828 family protein, partial [Sporomusaceae bacterium]|nr:DUF2828 family protein [Sporomusaceae bacterium]
MLKFLKAFQKEPELTLTENGAAAYATSNSDCLDLFATIGALRREPETEISARFDRAWAENADLALKTLFFARDIRGGLGERYVFRAILRSLAWNRAESLAKNIWAVPEFGRFDDLLPLLDTPAKQVVFEYLKTQFEKDIGALATEGTVSLLGKWLPSINAHNAAAIRYGKMIAKCFGLSQAEYRKSLTALRAQIAIIENNLREQDYSFDYAKQPAKAMFKYRKAFLRNDGGRYREYLARVERGEAKLNVGALLPYEIIRPALSGGSTSLTAAERRSMDVTWQAQNDFTRGENALVVIDGSSSMYGWAEPQPAAVALALGIYFAERNKGAFQNHFITFSENPRLIELKGKDIF